MKKKYLINFYIDGVLSSQQRFFGGDNAVKCLAKHVVAHMALKNITVTYKIIPQ